MWCTWVPLMPHHTAAVTATSYFKADTCNNFFSQTFRRNNQMMIVRQRPPQTPTASRQTSTVMKQTAALVSHWYRCRTHQKTHRQERWEHHLYRLRMVRELLITQKLFSAKMVSGQGLFIVSDEWLAFGHRSKISIKKKKKKPKISLCRKTLVIYR